MSKSDKMDALQSALKPKPPVSRAAPRPKASAVTGPTYMVAPSRVGKTNITAYASQDYKSNLRLVQAKTGRSLQALILEGLNEVFMKYGVPVIDHE
jgi:hypothetical protein